MSQDIASLILRVDALEVKKADDSLKKFNNTADKTDIKSRKATTGINKFTTSLKKMKTPLMATVAILTATTVGIVSVARETENLKAQLKTMTGSMENANIEFERLDNFAKTTPFSLQQSVDAFIKLKALGLDPSERAMLSYGNTASAMGKSMQQMIEAVADASTNEFERLKEFGIKAKQQGDNVTFTFRGISTTVKKSSEEIQGYLLNIGETDFAGAMADRMSTIDAKSSNLTQTIKGLLREFDRGFQISTKFGDGIDYVAEAFDNATIAVKFFFSNLKADEITKWQNQAKQAMDILTAASKMSAKELLMVASSVERAGIEYAQAQLELLKLIPATKAITEANADLGRKTGIAAGQIKQLNDELIILNDNEDNFKTVDLTDRFGGDFEGGGFAEFINNLDISKQKIEDFKRSLNDAWSAGKISANEYSLAIKEIEPEMVKIKTESVDWANVAETGINGVTGSLIDMAVTGKSSFEDFAKSFLLNIAKMIAQTAILNAMKSSSIFGGLLTASADGNVFSGGKVKKHALGGVVSNPSAFPMAGGNIGTIAENEPEAIMPLKRGKNGRLGVESSGSGGKNVVINQNISVSGNGDKNLIAAMQQAASQGAQQGYALVLGDMQRGGTIGALAHV